MRRSTALVLVLVNGGILAGAGYALTRPSQSAECEEARATLRPDAEEVCRETRSRSRTSFSSGNWGTNDGASTHVSDRGGFGGTATHYSGGG